MDNTTLIILSAGNPQNALFPGIYDLMIPINGKPTIDYIIENALKWNVKRMVVMLHKDDAKTQRYLKFRKTNIELIVVPVYTKRIEDTLFESKKYIFTEHILIQFGDTIYSGEIDFSESNILTSSKVVSDPQSWCFVSNNCDFINRPSYYPKDVNLVIGLYYIIDNKKFFACLRKNKFYDSLEKYHAKYGLAINNIYGKHYDLGHLDEYYKSKIDFLRVRSFNSLEYDEFRGIITKKSSNHEKLLWEINWYKSLPQDLKNFTPRLTNYTLENKVEYSLEFYGYNSLADIFLYSDYPRIYHQNILDKILKYTTYVRGKYSNPIFGIEYFYDMYVSKTLERIEQLYTNPFLKDLYEVPSLFINGKEYQNLKRIVSEANLKKIVDGYIYKKEDITIIHGDLCFSNILYDTFNGIFKFIDPRGKFGKVGIWGDIKYDLAKLRHSVHGKYEYIISDLFNIQADFDVYEFEFNYFNEPDKNLIQYFDKRLIDNNYNPEIIKFIEGLLYLSMIPLHDDNLDRQIIMYLTAVELLNNFS